MIKIFILFLFIFSCSCEGIIEGKHPYEEDEKSSNEEAVVKTEEGEEQIPSEEKGLEEYSIVAEPVEFPEEEAEKKSIEPPKKSPWTVVEKRLEKPVVRKNLKTEKKSKEIKSLPPVEKKRKKWKPGPKKIKNNINYWAGNGFENTLLNECGGCDPVCHQPDLKADPGGFTCGGFSIRSRGDFYSQVINEAFKMCKRQGLRITLELGKLEEDKYDRSFGVMKNFCYYLRVAYWEHYYEKFSKCYYNAMMHLGDTAVLQGNRASIKILQRSAGIKDDGLWGPNSEKACSKANFNKKKFTEQRLKYLQSLRNWEPNARGWTIRVKKMEKKY